MSSTTPPARSSRRLRRAGSLAATAAIALSAVVGFGVAPASANVPLDTKETIQLHTHFSSGWNVRSVRVSAGTIIRNGKKQPAFNYCYDMGEPGSDGNATVTMHLPQNNYYQAVSYADDHCGVSFVKLGGASAGIPTYFHDWEVFARQGVHVY